MSYNRNIPQPTDLISNSQNQILGNFQTIDSGSTGTGPGFARNHITMTDATNGGLHSRVDYYQSVVDPDLVGFVSSLYPKATELFYRNASGIFQLTNLTLVTTTPGANGYGIVTPWGITLNWGVVGVGAGGPTSATALTLQSPYTNTFDTIVCTGVASNGSIANVTVNSPSIGPPTTVNLYCETNTSVYFFSIGH